MLGKFDLNKLKQKTDIFIFVLLFYHLRELSNNQLKELPLGIFANNTQMYILYVWKPILLLFHIVMNKSWLSRIQFQT